MTYRKFIPQRIKLRLDLKCSKLISSPTQLGYVSLAYIYETNDVLRSNSRGKFSAKIYRKYRQYVENMLINAEIYNVVQFHKRKSCNFKQKMENGTKYLIKICLLVYVFSVNSGLNIVDAERTVAISSRVRKCRVT